MEKAPLKEINSFGGLRCVRTRLYTYDTFMPNCHYRLNKSYCIVLCCLHLANRINNQSSLSIHRKYLMIYKMEFFFSLDDNENDDNNTKSNEWICIAEIISKSFLITQINVTISIKKSERDEKGAVRNKQIIYSIQINSRNKLGFFSFLLSYMLRVQSTRSCSLDKINLSTKIPGNKFEFLTFTIMKCCNWFKPSFHHCAVGFFLFFILNSSAINYLMTVIL